MSPVPCGIWRHSPFSLCIWRASSGSPGSDRRDLLSSGEPRGTGGQQTQQEQPIPGSCLTSVPRLHPRLRVWKGEPSCWVCPSSQQSSVKRRETLHHHLASSWKSSQSREVAVRDYREKGIPADKGQVKRLLLMDQGYFPLPGVVLSCALLFFAHGCCGGFASTRATTFT